MNRQKSKCGHGLQFVNPCTWIKMWRRWEIRPCGWISAGRALQTEATASEKALRWVYVWGQFYGVCSPGYTQYMLILCVCVHACVHAQSCLTFMTPMTIAHQVSLSMGLPRQEHWSGLLFPTPRDLPNSGIKAVFFVSPALAGKFFTTVPPGKHVY